MASTAGTVLRWKTWPDIAAWDKSFAGPFWAFAQTIMPDAYGTLNEMLSPVAREKFLQHNELMLNVVPKERLLCVGSVDSGESICLSGAAGSEKLRT